jgi:hypothetical protein
MKVLNIKVKKNYKKSLKSVFFEILIIKKYVDRILQAIEFGINNNLVKIQVFKIDYKGTLYNFTFHRNNWDAVLNITMKFYIKVEDYEKCTTIKKILEHK